MTTCSATSRFEYRSSWRTMILRRAQASRSRPGASRPNTWINLNNRACSRCSARTTSFSITSTIASASIAARSSGRVQYATFIPGGIFRRADHLRKRSTGLALSVKKNAARNFSPSADGASASPISRNILSASPNTTLKNASPVAPRYCLAVVLAIHSLSRRCHGCPALSDLVALEAPQHEASKMHSLFRSGVGPTPDVAAHDLVTLGDHVLDGHVKVGHFLVHPEHHLAIALHVRWFPARPVVIVEISVQGLA